MRSQRLLTSVALVGAGFLAMIWLSSPLRAADPPPQPLKSQIVRFEDAKEHKADWGLMKFYYTGETAATKNVLTAVAVVEPGKAVHKSHRHAEEEYLVLVDGSGVWDLDGKETPAQRGDILYAAPWVYHGLKNTGDKQLIFVVVRYNGKGVAVPPRPDDRPDER